LKKWILPASLIFLFFISVFFFQTIADVFLQFLPHKTIFIERTSLPELALQHIMLVVVSSLISIIIALGIAILTRIRETEKFQEFILSMATFGQTIPTVAVLALLVPFLGYGMKPILFALFLYGVLPILRNTIEGFRSIPPEVSEAARAMGMTPWQVIWNVEIPLALPAIVAGIRTSVILNISVATIGATVGVTGFGTLIVNGIRADDVLTLLKGAIPVCLLALAVDSIFAKLKILCYNLRHIE